MHNAITGKDDHLLLYLAQAIARATKIRFNVAFLMESGARLIAPHIQEACQGGAEIRILTGKYMSATEPSAIYYLIDKLDDKLDIRFYADSLRPFHPKAYIFDYEDDAEIFVGSSNLSHSALTSGLEWNYRLLRSQNTNKFSRRHSMTFLTTVPNRSPTAVLDYFQPRLLLGLTATPYRTDNRDIYAVCEDNVPVSGSIRDALLGNPFVPSCT